MNRRTATVLIDCLFALVLVLVLLPHEPEAKANVPPGQLIVEISWPSDLDTDVDLWVLAPTDQPVGYSAKSGRVFNLLRDDLGHVGDLTMSNVEMAVTRGLPDGEYQVNVHLYSNRSGVTSVPVEAHAIFAEHGAVLWTNIVELRQVGDEITVMRFTINDGQLDRLSLNDVPKPLRSPPPLGR